MKRRNIPNCGPIEKCVATERKHSKTLSERDNKCAIAEKNDYPGPSESARVKSSEMFPRGRKHVKTASREEGSGYHDKYTNTEFEFSVQDKKKFPKRGPRNIMCNCGGKRFSKP